MSTTKYLFANDTATVRVNVEVHTDNGPVSASLNRAIVNGITRGNEVFQITDKAESFQPTSYFKIVLKAFGGVSMLFALAMAGVTWILWDLIRSRPELMKQTVLSFEICAAVCIPFMVLAVAGSLCGREHENRQNSVREQKARDAVSTVLRNLLHT